MTKIKNQTIISEHDGSYTFEKLITLMIEYKQRMVDSGCKPDSIRFKVINQNWDDPDASTAELIVKGDVQKD